MDAANKLILAIFVGITIGLIAAQIEKDFKVPEIYTKSVLLAVSFLIGFFVL